ncbi:MAG: regulatory protein RecX [Oscillospiraceae bacterium]|nr:regulatory protein RecX [Oscillospiraceae bacterium]
MTVQSVAPYKGNTVEVCIDGSPVYLHKDIVFDFGLKAGYEITDEKYNEIICAALKKKAMERGLYLLDYRDHSYRELFEKLSKNYPDDVCFYVADRLTELGMINDRRYAQNLAAKFIKVKKYGPFRAVREMCLKGIEKSLAQEMVCVYSDQTRDILYDLVCAKYSRYLTDDSGIKKVKNALCRQGYGYDDINAVIDMCLDE